MALLSEADKRQIQSAYRRWLASKGLKPRLGQKQMIAEVARLLARSQRKDASREQVIAAIEAGTGTGKTVAYLLPALILAEMMQRKLVVSTATVALQEQLIDKDLPDLRDCAQLRFDFALAKGRGRYVCKAKLVAVAEQRNGALETMPLYPDEVFSGAEDAARALGRQLLDALEQGDWDGDRDHWSGPMEYGAWQPLTSDHAQCTGRRCVYVNECAYFAAREGLESATCVVANHDLVLADLSLGGGVILPAPEDTIYVFDEAHQLADKAQQHFGFRVRLAATSRWLDQLIGSLPSLAVAFGGDSLSTGLLERAPPMLQSLRAAVEDCRLTCLSLLESEPPALAEQQTLRFALGELPVQLGDRAHDVGFEADRLVQLFDTLCARFDDIARGDVPGAELEATEQWYAVLGQIGRRLVEISGLAAAFNPALYDTDSPQARWLSARQVNAGIELELCALPLLPGRLLEEMLWRRCTAAVLTSASITAWGQFTRFIEETGIPERSTCCRLDSPFNHFEAASLRIPREALDPAIGEPYVAMLVEQIPSVGDEGCGTLVLFTARRQMQAVYDGLGEYQRASVLMQGQCSKRELLARHRSAVDRGVSSVIFGLASFAEGVDLPGDYCTQVVITRLPFAVPDDPLAATLSEWVRAQGGEPFRDIALPDAARRLVQASGRLLRTEQDRGRITVLDGRLTRRRYGKQLLASMPNYRLLTT